MKLKLLNAIQTLSENNLMLLESIHAALEMRMDWLNDREPENSGVVYDSWSDKVDDLQDILDDVEDLLNETDVDVQTQLIEDIQSSVETYQLIHGGLSRLTI